MIGKRLAYKLWLVKEEHDSLVYTDTRALTFVRVMSLFFALLTLAGVAFVSSKGEVPLPVYLILGFFSLVFFSLFLLKAFSHKEVVFTSVNKKVTIQKKRFNTVLSETVFNFDQIKQITLGSVSRTDRSGDHGRRTHSHFEVVIEFRNDYNIHFSVITDPEMATASANKIADFVKIKMTSKI